MGRETDWLVDRQTGEGLTVDGETVEWLVGIEITVAMWAIDMNGWFENGRWRVTKAQ